MYTAWQAGQAAQTSDAGNVAWYSTNESVILWKTDAAGVPVWRKRFDPPTAYGRADIEMAACANGDLLLAISANGEYGAGLIDTVVLRWNLFRLGPSGDVLWEKSFTSAAQVSTAPSQYLMEVNENAFGDIMAGLIMVTPSLYSGQVILTKLDAAGDAYWNAKAQGWNWPCTTCIELVADRWGGYRLVAGHGSGYESAFIASISPGGLVDWARQFDYLGLVNSGASHAPAVVDSAGTTIFLTQTVSSNGGLHLVRISESGALVRVDRYALTSNCCASLCYDEDRVVVGFYDQVFAVDQTGVPSSMSGHVQLPADATYAYAWNANELNMRNGRALLPYWLSASPLQPGLPWYAPAISSFWIDAPPQCLRAVNTVAHDSLPANIFTCTAVAGIALQPVALTIVDGTMSGFEMPLPTTVNLCGTTNVEDPVGDQTGFTLAQNFIARGSPIVLRADRPMEYRLINALGAVVLHHRGHQSATHISSFGLAPGRYIIAGHDGSGQLVGRADLLIGL